MDGIFPDPNGRLWVERRVEDDSPSSIFDVFDERGVLLGTVTAPRYATRSIPSARDNRFYMVTLDSLDVPVVHAFRIEPS